MALKGTLGDFSLADILQLIGLQRKTGKLILRRDADEVLVGFDSGRVVFAEAASRPLEQRVGRLLVRTGKLTETRLEQALAIQRETLQRLGHVLSSKGWVDSEAIRLQLTLQITETVYELFRWKDGEYDFQPGAKIDWDQEFIRPIPCESLLMEGAQMVDEWPLIERVIPSRLTVLRPTEAALEILATAASKTSEVRGSVYEDDIDFGFIPSDPLQEEAKTGAPQITRREAEILRWVDGRRSAMEVAELSEQGIFDGFKTLARLIEARLVEVAQEDGSRQRTRVPRLFLSAASARLAGLFLAASVLVGTAVAVQETVQLGWPGASRLPLPRSLASSDWLARASGVDLLRRASSAARLSRLEQALRTHYLARGRWPASLGELVRGGLVGDELMRDPWGREYAFSLDEWGYRIGESGRTGRLPALVREHRFTSLERSINSDIAPR